MQVLVLYLYLTYLNIKDFSISDGSSDLLLAIFQPIEKLDVYPCTISSIKQDYRKIGNGMVYQKDWPYTKLFNHHLLKVCYPTILTQLNMKQNICPQRASVVEILF